MAFTSVSPSSVQNFFSSLMTFASTTTSVFTDEGILAVDANTNIYRLSKGSVHWSFRVNITTTVVDCRMTYAKITTDAEFANSSGGGGTTTGQQSCTAFGLHNRTADLNPDTGYFYQQNNCVHAVLELEPNLYNHVSFGIIDKFGTWDGGEYVTAGNAQYGGGTFSLYHVQLNKTPFSGSVETFSAFSRGGGYIRIANTASESDFMGIGNGITSGQYCTMSTRDGIYGVLIHGFGLSGYNNRAPMLPIYVRLRDTATDTFWFIGQVPGVWVLNVQNSEPASLVESNTYRVFPIFNKSLTDITVNPWSYNEGLAYIEA